MKCQDCDAHDATVNLTQIVNNEKVVLNLCKDCAAKRGFHSPLDNIPFPLANFLSGMMETDVTGEKSTALTAPDLTCSNCGLSFEEFSRLGRFGCGECYKTFREKLQALLRKIHGSSLHRGKLPPMLSEDATVIKEQERLEQELTHAIDSEDFERAADLRDKLKSLKEADEIAAGKEKENV
ncbi:MAG: UvrB/UvrC motif-containing protein [candidate division Zixibacteria bacterium]|nr:UvrB/UvrC motif-containing protein [candidate division Zixibacteria bacterium]